MIAQQGIDFMNSAPDFDITSLGEENFQWVVEKMADLVVELAQQPRRMHPVSWDVMMRA